MNLTLRLWPPIIGCFLFLAFLIPLSAFGAEWESVYTELESKHCKTLPKQEGDPEDSSEQMCPGTAGYRLKVVEGDLRQSIIVIAPGGKEYPLDLWTVIAGGFSFLGPKAEWRVEKKDSKILPRALIVRFNASEDSSNPNKKTSYLAVIKVTPDVICVTDRISPSADMNEKARKAADGAAGRPCLKAP